MDSELKSKTVAIWDTGFFVPIAEYMVPYCKKVLYYCPRESGYMRSNDDRVGEGIKGVEKIDSIWDKIDDIDFFIFTDCYFVAEQEYLKKLGKLVWGTGKTSWMEQDRFRMREYQEKNDMYFPDTEEYIGIDDLKDNVKDGQFIKISKYRADFETMKHYDASRSDQRFDELKVRFGAYKDKMPFLVEDKIDGIEIGYDGWSVDGKFPTKCIFGMEVKDRGYLGKVSPYEVIPKTMRDVNEAVSKAFAEEKMRGPYSSEIRIDRKTKKPYLIDQTMRYPNPPYQLELEMFENYAECIYQGAKGKLIDPILAYKYGAIAIMHSEFSQNNWLGIQIPKEIKRFVKVSNMCVINNETYSIPFFGLIEVGAVIGLGNTAQEAIDHCKKNADQVNGDRLEIDVDVLDEALETLSDAKEFGVNF